MLVKDIKSQRGVGLVEVMVALLLLAGAVLGFSAMQLSAIKATDESLMRTRAISSIKALSESMRVLPDSSAVYRQQVNTIYTNNK
ncbi:prepilin-type N-terminal cleavage/methylation domain-containing protein, partial [uncultured Psychrobacter sp.]|uniref:prepilin-type N-terminal cleavage/methylation domain-containing protein n=1 Tax=uncultured Psychrobacter sp. TaxID=259303 RepID=UPI0030D8E55B